MTGEHKPSRRRILGMGLAVGASAAAAPIIATADTSPVTPPVTETEAVMAPETREGLTNYLNLRAAGRNLEKLSYKPYENRPDRKTVFHEDIFKGNYTNFANVIGPRLREFYEDNIEAYRIYYKALKKYYGEKKGQPELAKEVETIEMLDNLKFSLKTHFETMDKLGHENVDAVLYGDTSKLLAATDKSLNDLCKKMGFADQHELKVFAKNYKDLMKEQLGTVSIDDQVMHDMYRRIDTDMNHFFGGTLEYEVRHLAPLLGEISSQYTDRVMIDLTGKPGDEKYNSEVDDERRYGYNYYEHACPNLFPLFQIRSCAEKRSLSTKNPVYSRAGTRSNR